MRASQLQAVHRLHSRSRARRFRSRVGWPGAPKALPHQLQAQMWLRASTSLRLWEPTLLHLQHRQLHRRNGATCACTPRSDTMVLAVHRLFRYHAVCPHLLRRDDAAVRQIAQAALWFAWASAAGWRTTSSLTCVGAALLLGRSTAAVTCTALP